MKEVDAFIEKRLYGMYQLAANYKLSSFLFIQLRSQDIKSMFYINLEQRVEIEDEHDE